VEERVGERAEAVERVGRRRSLLLPRSAAPAVAARRRLGEHRVVLVAGLRFSPKTRSRNGAEIFFSLSPFFLLVEPLRDFGSSKFKFASSFGISRMGFRAFC
jgi:hypothetical protein